MIVYINVTEIAARNGLVNYLHLVIIACVKVMIPTSMYLEIEIRYLLYFVLSDTLTFNDIPFMSGFIFSTYQS
jgi:hypothetical protein